MARQQRLAKPGEVNGDLVDGFTLVHASFGALMRVAKVPFWATALLGVGWEMAENILKDELPVFFPTPTHDRFEHATFDALAVMAGWGVAQKSLPPGR